MTKIDIVSGFLGAGKTTLIKKLLKEALAGTKVVLIENEFGDIGIDGGFLKESGIEIREMNAGCICCSLVGDFGTSLKEVMEAYAPERILIEPSGVGKLSDVMRAINDASEHTQMHLNSAVAVVDASKCKVYLKNFGEFFDNQIAYAGTIILSRTDKISDEKILECVDLLRNINADATIITTPIANLDGKMKQYVTFRYYFVPVTYCSIGHWPFIAVANSSILHSFYSSFYRERLPLFEYLLCFDDDGVVLAEEHEVVLHLAYIIDDVAVDGPFEEAAALLQHQVAAAQLVLFAELCELFQQVLLAQVLFHAVDRSERCELGAVLVGIGEGKLADESRQESFAIVAGHARGVFRHKDVGRDAATAIDGAADAGLVLLALLMDAVLREELAAFVACQQVVFVLFAVPFLVGFLDAAAAGRIVAGHGEADHAAVAEVHGLLHQALAEGASAHDGAAVVVLNGSGEYLAGAGAAFIHKHHDGQLLEGAAPVADELLAWTFAPFGIDDELACGQEFVDHLYGDVHVSSSVAPEVHDELPSCLPC